MDKHYATQQTQQLGQAEYAAMKRQLQAIQPGYAEIAPQPAPPAGVMDLIENAHGALGDLQGSIATLCAVLHPVTLPLQDGCNQSCQEAPSDAPAVSALRALISRIHTARDSVAELTKSVRV